MLVRSLVRRSTAPSAASSAQHDISASSSSVLRLCIQRVCQINQLETDDVFKLVGLLTAGEDPLHVKKTPEFAQALWRHHARNLSAASHPTSTTTTASGGGPAASLSSSSMSPFQKGFIDNAFQKLIDEKVFDLSAAAAALAATTEGPNSQPPTEGRVVTAAAASSAAAVLSPQEQDIEDRLTAIWEVARSARQQQVPPSARSMRQVSVHVSELLKHIRQLSSSQFLSFVESLATLFYKDDQVCSALCRRSSELALKLSGSEACKLYRCLGKLNTQDSLVALTNRIEASVEQLEWYDVSRVLRALEGQSRTSAAASKLLPKLASRIPQALPQANSSAFHRSFLQVAARYSLQRHPSVVLVLQDLSRFESSLTDRDVVFMFQSIVDMKLPPSTAGVSLLLQRIDHRIASSFDLRMLDTVVDLLSLYPCDSQQIMEKAMHRLTVDAGKLLCGQMISLAELFASYPPVRGHPCTVSMLFAAAMMKDAYDAEGIERLVLAFTEMQCFASEDYFVVADFSISHRQGLRSFVSLSHFLSLLDPQAIQSHPRILRLVPPFITKLAAVLNDEEVNHVRKEMIRLQVEDGVLNQKLMGRVRALQREAGAKKAQRYRRGYDPTDDL